MRDRIRRLSWKVELAAVLILAFGWTLPGTLLSLTTSAAMSRGPTPPVSDAALWGTILFELILLSLLVPFLRVRGWTLARLGVRPSWRGCLQGAGLALAANVLYVGFAVLVAGIWPEVAHALAQTHLVGQDLSWTTIAIVSTINPFYEEMFICGYVISVLTERQNGGVAKLARATPQGEAEFAGNEPQSGATSVPMTRVSLATTVNTSAMIRLSYHLYQGVAGVLSIAPLGLLFAFWFARTRQLWPLIVAHAILDFVGLPAVAG